MLALILLQHDIIKNSDGSATVERLIYRMYELTFAKTGQSTRNTAYRYAYALEGYLEDNTDPKIVRAIVMKRGAEILYKEAVKRKILKEALAELKEAEVSKNENGEEGGSQPSAAADGNLVKSETILSDDDYLLSWEENNNDDDVGSAATPGENDDDEMLEDEDDEEGPDMINIERQIETLVKLVTEMKAELSEVKSMVQGR